MLNAYAYMRSSTNANFAQAPYIRCIIRPFLHEVSRDLEGMYIYETSTRHD